MSIAEKLTTIAENEQKVYDKGRSDEWSDFWDIYQDYGNRTNYGSAFGVYTTSHYSSWEEKNYRPKYDMRPTNMDRMYQQSRITDLVTIHEQLGITLDTSNCTVFSSCFANAGYFTHIPEISAVKCVSNSFNNVFAACRGLVTIDKIILPETGNIIFSTTFNSCVALQNITFEGVIGQSIDFSWSPLSVASITNIFEHLSATTSGTTLTLKKTAVNEAFGIDVDDESTYPEGSEYYTLRHSRDNWNVSYV